MFKWAKHTNLPSRAPFSSQDVSCAQARRKCRVFRTDVSDLVTIWEKQFGVTVLLNFYPYSQESKGR